MPEYLQTGHDLVDKFGCIPRQGFIHDNSWLRHPRLQSPNSQRGLTNLAHSILWAYLVDLYRPIKRHNPETGEAYYQKKFEGEYFITTYSHMARILGIAVSSVRNAFKHWKEGGMIGMLEAPDARDPEKGNQKPFRVWPIPSAVRDVTGRGSIDTVELASHLQTGSWVCDELAQIKIQGHVIDYNWLTHPFFRKEGGRGWLNAALIIVYAELFFFHTPKDIEDEITHKVVARKKRFDGEVLYKGYASWESSSGLTDDQLRDAVAELRKELAIVDWGPVLDRQNEPTNTKVLIALRVDAALEVTFGTRKVLPRKDNSTRKKRDSDSENGSKSPIKKRGDRSPETGDRSPETGDRSPETGDRLPETGQLHSKEHTLSKVGTKFPQQHQEGAVFTATDEATESRVGGSSNDEMEAATPRTHRPSASRPRHRSEQVSLPVVTEVPSAPFAALPLRDFVLEVAKAQGLALDTETAARLAARLKIDERPAAQLSPAELLDLITKKRDRVFLDATINGDLPRKMAYEETDKLRFYLAIWPAFDESKESYWASKRRKIPRTNCFLNRYKTKQLPPEEWLDEQLKEFQKARAAEIRAEKRVVADALMAILSPAELTALDLQIRERNRGVPTENATRQYDHKRIDLLTDESFVEDLRAGKFNPQPAAPKPVATPTPVAAAALADDEDPPAPPRALSDFEVDNYAAELLIKWTQGKSPEWLTARIDGLISVPGDRDRLASALGEKIQKRIEFDAKYSALEVA